MAISLRVRVLACAECKETLSVYSLFIFTAGNQGDKLANLTMGPPRKITSHQPLLGPRRSPPPRGLRRTPTHTVEYAGATHPRSKRTRGGERRRTHKSGMTCNFIKHTCCSPMCVRQGDVRARARSRAHTPRLPTAANEQPKGALAQQPIIPSPRWNGVRLCVCVCVCVLYTSITYNSLRLQLYLHFSLSYKEHVCVYAVCAVHTKHSLLFIFLAREFLRWKSSKSHNVKYFSAFSVRVTSQLTLGSDETRKRPAVRVD